MKEYALLCVYSDIRHLHFMLHRVIIYITLLSVFVNLVGSVINAVKPWSVRT